MITQQYKDLAKWAMKFALDKGCSDARVSISQHTSNSFEYRDLQLDKIEQAGGNGMGIMLYVDGRFASYSTNRLDKRELERYIGSSVEATRFLAKDEFRKLPDPSRYYTGDGKGLDTYDGNFEKLTADERLDILKATATEVYGADERIISVSSMYDDGVASHYQVASNGFEGNSESTYFSLSASVSLKGAGDARPSDYWYDSSIFWEKLQKTGIGKTAFERALRKLGQEKINSGVYPMILDNTQSTRLLSPVISALYGNSIQQKNSFLVDKVGERIASENFTLIDDPHIPRASGARWFDGEGVATMKRTMIDRGVLQSYYIDTYSGAKLNMEPTVQGPSILTCVHGEDNFDTLLAGLDRGIWVTGFNGGNSNSTTGDFSFGIEGFLIENGKVVKAINEMNITGNLLTVWQNIVAVGNDPKLTSSWRIPSLVFDAVNFSGK